MSTGKVFHTDEGGAGNVCPGPTCWMNGPAMPPFQDPRSWTRGLSMADVNAVAAMAHCDAASAPGTAGACAVNASLSGDLSSAAEAAGEAQLCDRVIADDAVVKLRLAAGVRNRTGQPFFLAVGFRRPHRK